MQHDEHTPYDRLMAYLRQVGHRAWWAAAALVVVVALFAVLGDASGVLVVIAIQLTVLALVVYFAVRLALRHHR